MKFKVWLLLLGITSFLQAQKSENLKQVSSSENFVLDIRYAGSNNFLKKAFYNCAVCYLRPEVAKALQKANAYFIQKGYKILLYDCFRPVTAQKMMWNAFPDPHYVANPYTKGSVHSRGAAVDVSLVHLDGSPVNMGTDHDFFGKDAHIDHTDLPATVLENRKLLQEGMRHFGFTTIRTEWWHFDFKKAYSYPILDVELPCE